MTMLAAKLEMTLAEFLAMPDSGRFELVEGRLEERKLGALADHVAMLIVSRLVLFCAAHNLGFVFGPETTYRCFGHPKTGRRADVSFIARGRLAGDQIPAGEIEIPADLAVEVVSPKELAYEVEDKVELYLRHGFGGVWVVYPNTRSMHIHRPGQAMERLDSEQVLKGHGPLAGFECPVMELFPRA